MRKEILLSLLLFFAISLVFFYPLFKGYIPFPGDLLVGGYAPYNSYMFMGFDPGGYPNKAQGFDVLKLLYPVKEFAMEMLKQGQLPLWNPYNFSGNPLFASLQAGAFYPFNLLFLLIPFMVSWSLYILLQPILAGVFTYILLREFQLSSKSSLLGALAFAFSSYMIVWIEYGNIGHTILWLPAAFWLLYRNLKKPGFLQSIALIFVFTFSILAGYVQLAIHLFAFLAGFVIFYVFALQSQNKIKTFMYHLPIFVAPVLLAAVQLLPAIELFQNSTRLPYTFDNFVKLLIPQFHIVTAFVPDFFGNPATRNYWLTGTYIERVSYIGVIPLFFAIYGLLQKRTPIIWFFTGTLVVVFFLVFDSFVTKALYALYMPPILSTGVPSRMMYIFCFSIAVLSAFGYDAFEKSKSAKKLFRLILVFGGIYLLLWIFVFLAPRLIHADWVNNLATAKRNLILPTCVFGMLCFLIAVSQRTNVVRKYLFVLIFGLTIFELFYFFHKITPFSPREAVYPETEVLVQLKRIQGNDRSWGYGSAYLEPNIQTHEKIYMPHGYDALHIKWYGELLTASYKGNIDLPPRSEADIAPGFGKSALRENPFRQQLLNLLGVKYILHKVSPENKDADYETFPKDIYSLLWQKGSWQIYENKRSLPRAMLFANYIVETDKNSIVEKLMDEKFDPSKTVILEQSLDPNLEFNQDNKQQEVTVVNYAPNKVVLKTKSEGDSILFLSDTYFTGWNVSIDGINDKIYKADYAFRAVPVSKGEHEVIFWYYPSSFDLGLKISIGTLFVLILFALVRLKKTNA